MSWLRRKKVIEMVERTGEETLRYSAYLDGEYVGIFIPVHRIGPCPSDVAPYRLCHLKWRVSEA